MQLCLGHIQRACSNFTAASEDFLQPILLSLIGTHSASEDTRFQVCCLLTVFLAAASPTQEAKVHRFKDRTFPAQLDSLAFRVEQKDFSRHAGLLMDDKKFVSSKDSNFPRICFDYHAEPMKVA